MAKAPDPKQRAAQREREERKAQPQVLLRVTVDGDAVDVDPAQIGPGDDILAMKHAGMSVTEALIAVEHAGVMPGGIVTLLWWIGRRKAGESVTWPQACDEIGGFGTWEGRVLVEQVTDDPEG